MKDLVDRIMAYGQDDLPEEKAIELLQDLVDSGLAWTLQGRYGRTASRLIDVGLVKPNKRKRKRSQ